MRRLVRQLWIRLQLWWETERIRALVESDDELLLQHELEDR